MAAPISKSNSLSALGQPTNTERNNDFETAQESYFANYKHFEASSLLKNKSFVRKLNPSKVTSEKIIFNKFTEQQHRK
jgi:hypothetical protein